MTNEISMKNIIIAILSLCISGAMSNAQNYTNVSVSNTTPVSTHLENVRYEFVQSTLNASHAFLIDKHTGDVWRYRILKKEFDKIEREEPDTVDTEKVNYQLYMSGDNNSMCFLLNIHTGQMWRYASKDGEKTFKRMEMPWGSNDSNQ